jgi:hypothetical protein
MTLEKEGSQFWEFPDLGFTIEFREASHRWWLHELVEGKSKRWPVVSVTGVLKVLDKPQLLPWAEACGGEGMLKLERMGELEGLSGWQAVKRMRELGFGMDAKRDAAAARGTLVHRVLEVYGRTGEPPEITSFEPEIRGYVQGLCGWLLDYAPRPVAIEQPVASRLHGFAGRVDLFAETGSTGLELWDLKTNPGGRVYTEAHLQTAAYELAGIECGMDPDRVMLLAVAEDGEYQVSHCHASGDDFLAVLEVSRVMRKLRKAAGADEAEL